MKVLFAVSNESISESIVKKYQQIYKEIVSSKNVYYFNAILKELQKDKTYDRIVISEDLEPFTNNNHDTIDNFIFDKLDGISDEAFNTNGDEIPIILIATDRRSKSDGILVKLFGIGVYSTLMGQDRSIEKICNLINKPRTKKEAKSYYQIDSNEVGYKSENEGNVDEVEIQNIINYYKRLGKNEDRYSDVFDSIANQYSDQQLKIIIKYLPLPVKAVLEEKNFRYQQLTSFPGEWKNDKKPVNFNNYAQNSEKKEKEENTGVKIKTIGTKPSSLNTSKPVIIPSTVSTSKVKKITKKTEEESIPEVIEEIFEKEEMQPEDLKTVDELIVDIENDDKEEVATPAIETQPEVVEPVKKGRGRPKKIKTPEEEMAEKQPKRGRGRPKKVQEIEEVEDVLPGFEDIQEDDDEETLPGFEDIQEDDEDEDILPGFENVQEDDEDEDTLPGFEDVQEDDNDEDTLPGFEDVQENDEDEDTLPLFEDDGQEDDSGEEALPGLDIQNKNEQDEQAKRIEQMYKERQEQQTTNRKPRYEDLINYGSSKGSSSDFNSSSNKVVAFVGTSKNGTSFMVNNLAEMLSNQGIKTAILDLTRNRNSFYIYTKNEEELRKTAYRCIEKLTVKQTDGIKVNKNLDVYTSLPGENNNINQSETILDTLQKNYSLVLLDCDFETDLGYFRQAKEIFLVQSLDVLTIQPLTAFLRELKAKGILEPNKIKIVINKFTKVRSISDRAIIGGMAFYNDPAMSFMTELFNKDKVVYEIVPFDIQVYSKYLEALAECKISISGYPKDFLNHLRKVANLVYPLVAKDGGYNKKVNTNYNNYQSNFSSNMNNTLDKMKNNY